MNSKGGGILFPSKLKTWYVLKVEYDAVRKMNKCDRSNKMNEPEILLVSQRS